MKKIVALSYNDLRNVIREPMLLFLTAGPFLLTLAIRWMLPFVAKYFESYIDLRIYYPLIAGFVLIFIPMLLGMLTGFLLLDERDDNVFMTLIVTPLAKNGYIAYRILLPTVISFIYTLIILPLINIVSIDFLTLLPIALLAALEAPIAALYLVVFAGNKVEGLALSKALGIFMIAPLIGYFIDSKWKLLAGLIPFYWPVMTLVVGDYLRLDYWIYLGFGIFIHIILLILLLRRFDKKIT